MDCFRLVLIWLVMPTLQDVLFYPCPKNGPTYRQKAIQLSGKSQFPFLVDPNTGENPTPHSPTTSAVAATAAAAGVLVAIRCGQQAKALQYARLVAMQQCGTAGHNW